MGAKEQAEKLLEEMDAQDIDVEYEGIMRLDDQIVVLFDGDKVWKTDKESLVGLVSDSNVAITDEGLERTVEQLKDEARHELEGMSQDVERYLDRVLEELEVG